MNRAPSIKRLCTVPGITPEKAKLIRSIWQSTADIPFDQADAPRTWQWAFNACYHTPNRREMKRAAIDEIAEMHGVEYLGTWKRTGNGAYYCNAGDTCIATLLFNGSLLSVGCWGDAIERNLIRERSN